MLITDTHAETVRLLALLLECPVGEMVTYAAMGAAIGRDVKRCRHYVYSALRCAQRDHGAVFATEWCKGYRRLRPEELEKIGQTARSRIRKQAQRGAKAITAGLTGANNIDPATHRRILAEQTALGLLEHIARDKNLPEIPEDSGKPLPVAIAAKDFFRRIGGV